MRPFRVDVPEAELTELRRRIKSTQLPEKEPVEDMSQGVQLATVEKLARYWADDYDWRRSEVRINAFPNFITEIDGLDIHFIQARSKHNDVLQVAHVARPCVQPQPVHDDVGTSSTDRDDNMSPRLS